MRVAGQVGLSYPYQNEWRYTIQKDGTTVFTKDDIRIILKEKPIAMSLTQYVYRIENAQTLKLAIEAFRDCFKMHPTNVIMIDGGYEFKYTIDSSD